MTSCPFLGNQGHALHSRKPKTIMLGGHPLARNYCSH